jgi:hypothetical protein
MPATRRSTGRSALSASADLLCVPPDRVGAVWPLVAVRLERAMRRGDCGDYAAVRRAVHDGGMLLWLAWDGTAIIAAAVTELARLNGRKICTIVACGGEGWPRFGALIAGLEKFARAEGCEAVRIVGRKGWARVLPDYAIKRIILEKAL